MCQGRSTPYIGDKHDKLIPPLIGNPDNLNPYYKVDDPYHRLTIHERLVVFAVGPKTVRAVVHIFMQSGHHHAMTILRTSSYVDRDTQGGLGGVGGWGG